MFKLKQTSFPRLLFLVRIKGALFSRSKIKVYADLDPGLFLRIYLVTTSSLCVSGVYILDGFKRHVIGWCGRYCISPNRTWTRTWIIKQLDRFFPHVFITFFFWFAEQGENVFLTSNKIKQCDEKASSPLSLNARFWICPPVLIYPHNTLVKVIIYQISLISLFRVISKINTPYSWSMQKFSHPGAHPGL